MTFSSNTRGDIAAIAARLAHDDSRATRLRSDETNEGVAQVLESLLLDKSSDVDLLARLLRLVHLFSTPGLLRAVVDILRERSDLAAQAAGALARSREPSTIPELEGILKQRALAPECRAGAARVLGYFPDPRAKASILFTLRASEEDPLVLGAAARALGDLQARERLTDAAGELYDLLRSSSPDVRYAALDALGRMGAKEALEHVESLLDDGARTAAGMPIDEKAAQVSRSFRAEGSFLEDLLAECSLGNSGEWSMLRELICENKKTLPAALTKRLESCQFMSEESIRSLVFNYFGVQ
jgi:HEAT repeats